MLLKLLLACAASAPPAEPPTADAVAWMPLGDEVPRLCLSPVPQAGGLSRGERQALAAARARVAEGEEVELADLPEHPGTDVLRGARHVARDEVEEARQVFRDVANVWTEDACVQQAAAYTSFRAGQVTFAKPYMDAATGAWPSHPDVGLLDAVVQATVLGDVDAALSSLRRVVQTHPEHVPSRAWLGRVLARLSLYDEAVPHLLVAHDAGIDVIPELATATRLTGEVETYLRVVGSAPPLPRDVRADPDPLASYQELLGITPGQPLVAVLETSMGTMECTLHWEQAPLTVANFVTLARGLGSWVDPDTGQLRSDALYDGVVFHRVIPEFMVQTGDPTGTGAGGPGYAFVDETHPDLRFDRAGVLAMANSGPNTNGSQWFVTEVPVPHLDGRHTIFGTCTPESVVVARTIARVPTAGMDKPVEDVVLEGVRFR